MRGSQGQAMGREEDIGSPNKSDKPSRSTPQEQLNSPLNPEWANVQAYYGPGIPMQPPPPPPYMNCAVMAGHSPYHPHMWASPPQAMMANYGVPYSSMYPPHGIVYAHPAVPLVAIDGQQQPNNNKSSDFVDKTPQTTKKRKGSNDKMQVESDGQVAANRREHGNDDASSNDSDNNIPATSSLPGVEEHGNHNTKAKVVVDGSHLLVESRQSKRERRKQANRESARRSRLRKQSETEELTETYESLKMENISLKSEINQLIDQSDKLRLENQALSLREAERFNNPQPEMETRNPGLLLLTQPDQGTDESKNPNYSKRKKTKAVVVA